MIELKATGGEWVADGYEIRSTTCPISLAKVAVFNKGKANADLMAASYGMYRLLERLEKFCDEVTDEDTRLYGEAKSLSYEIDDLLAKARGES